MVCTFFGHKDTPFAVEEKLEQVLRKLIEEKTADTFYVGNQGNFDSMVRSVLRRLKKEYPQISYAVALAYMPGKRYAFSVDEPLDTFLPEGIEEVPRRFAISYRNKWLVDNSDMVLAYIDHSWGGAAQFVEKARRRKMPVINLAEPVE